ncbi:MAG: hypothetical protein J5819_02550 [Eubacterium sp.]|nr:hypothetical protein [Eubacterium sp.]
MLYWYRDLMVNEKLEKRKHKHLYRIERYYNALPKSRIFSDRKRVWEHFIGKKIPWREYFVVTRAYNPEDLFDVVGVRQWVLRHYSKTDIYVIGIYTTPFEAIKDMEEILVSGYGKSLDFLPRELFADDADFLEFNDWIAMKEESGEIKRRKKNKKGKKSNQKDTNQNNSNQKDSK